MNLVSKATALDCVEEAKAAAAKDDCPVLQQIARANVQSADEPLFQALASCGLAVKMPMEKLTLDTSGFTYPCFPPKEQLEAVARNGNFHKILGVPIAYSDYVLPQFWAKYKTLHPDHDLFSPQQTQLDFKHVLPFYLHGDGGRTYRKDSILILSMFNALGAGTAKSPAELQPHAHAKRQRQASGDHGISYDPGVNLLGNTLGNRFLFCAMKSELYKKKEGRFTSLLEHWTQYLRNLLEEGFEYNGDVWRIAILGLTGDAPFLREAGSHNRSFSSVAKTVRGAHARALKGCCWLCSAGMTGGPPFEDVRITQAQWLQHTGSNNPLPWTIPSPLLDLPTNDSDLASFYCPDIFHVYHAGCGKDFTASAIIYMMKQVYRRRNINQSLDDINQEFKAWLSNNKTERIHFGSFSLELLGYYGSRSFPKGHWSKNMDTATIGKFVGDLCIKGLVDFPRDEFLSLILDACSTIAHFMHILFHSSYWLTESEGWQLIQSGCGFLKAYVKLAEKAHAKGLCLWSLKPVIHLLAHIVHTALQQYRADTTCVINPVAESTFMCEDFVGRVSRLSRRVNAKQHGRKIMYRYMVAAHVME